MSLFGWLFNTPQYTFEKAEAALASNDTRTAISLLIEIQEQHNQAAIKIAEIKLFIGKSKAYVNELEEALKEFHEIFKIKQDVKRDFDRVTLYAIESKASAEIAKILFQQSQNFIKSNNFTQAEKSLDETLKWCNNETEQVKINALNELAKIEFNKGIKHEKANNLKSALLEFKKAFAQFTSIDKNDLYYQISIRIEICNLKQGGKPNEKNIEILSKQNSQFKTDLLYRYALYLAQNGKISDCENLIAKYLLKTSKDIQKLITFCKEYYVKQATKEIDLINSNLFSEETKEIEKLYNHIDLTIPSVKKGLPNLVKDIELTKQYLFSKLINRYFEEDEFEKVLSHISSFPKFYEQPELLKNAGIACLRLVVEGKINLKNYQDIVSTWLTAIYSDRVILKSLDFTSWDDDYTFTLLHSIGSHYMFENDVENVNFDEVTDDNISIGATQKELVHFFETTLNGITDNRLLKTILDFYNIEKEALENIIETISTELTYSTPYFSKQHNLSEIVLNHLSTEFENEQDENILDLGLKYVKDSKPTVFEQYLTAKNHLNSVIAAIENKNLSVLKSQKSINNSALINKFGKLKKSFEERLIRIFSTLTEKEEENENIVELFEEAIQISPTKEQLKYQYSMFIVDLCVSRINKEKMKNERGLTLLTKAFKSNTENSRVAHNLAIVTKFNCLDMLNDNITSSCKNQLQELINIRNRLLSQSLRNELADVLNGVLQQIRRSDPELVKLMEEEIGIDRQRVDNSLLVSLRFSSFDTNRATLNSAGRELAQKLKLIKNLID